MIDFVRCRKSAVFLVTTCALATFFFAGAASAAETQKGGEVFTLGEVEVTARGEEAKNTTIEKVPDREMREFNRDTAGAALNLLPGVTLSAVGARNEQMIYVRGLDVRHVPIFLDGVPMYVPYDGYPDLNRFTTFDLSEIVLSKGFTSVLYGPNTMGGAINLVSKRPDKPFEGNAGVGWFTGNGFETYGNFGTNQKLWYAQGGASYLSSDYFVLSRDFRPTSARTEDGGQRENSYSRDRKYNLKFGLTPADGHEYALSYWNQHGVKGVPPYTGTDTTQTPRFWQWPFWDKEGLYFNSTTPIGKESYAKTRLYYDTYKNSLFAYDDATYSTMRRASSFKSDYDDHTYGGSVEVGTSLIPRNLLKLAGHYKIDIHKEHNEPNPYQRFEDNIYSIGAEDTITLTKRLYSIIGVSYDSLKTKEAKNFNSTTGRLSDFPTSSTDAWNPQGGLFYSLTDTAKISFSVSDKTRFPTIKDKYSFRLGSAIPNPDLKPERGTNYELGYQDVLFKRVSLKAALFYRDIEDFILQATVPDPAAPGRTTLQNQNIGHVEQYGFEIDLSGSILATLDGGVNYTYLNNNNRSNSDKLTNVPDHKLFTYVKYTPLKPLSFLADMEIDSQRYSSTNGVRIAKGFTLVNAKAMYEIGKGLVIEGGVRNVLDKDYALEEGFPAPGRTYFSNLTYRF